MIEFFLPLKKIPTVTAQQKQISVVKGKPLFYEPPKLKAARSMFMAHLGQYVPRETFVGPVRLTVRWLYPKTQKAKIGQYKATKPDLDNANKLLQDCMTKLKFWNDDSQVASLIAEKFYSDVVGIYIRIEQLESD